MRTVLAIGAAILMAVSPSVRGGDGATQSDALTERLLKFRVTGAFERLDPLAGTVTFGFSGPFFSTVVDPDTGLIGDEPGPRVGTLDGAMATFRFDGRATFSCDECTMTFDDGSVLEPIVDDPSTPSAEPDVPMEGRLLFELGPVPGGAPGTITLRGIGCGGAEEVAGAGMFAGLSGAICINGTFTFPSPLPSDPAGWFDAQATGESDCTFVFH